MHYIFIGVTNNGFATTLALMGGLDLGKEYLTVAFKHLICCLSYSSVIDCITCTVCLCLIVTKCHCRIAYKGFAAEVALIRELD
jgi:hypothetical protein